MAYIDFCKSNLEINPKSGEIDFSYWDSDEQKKNVLDCKTEISSIDSDWESVNLSFDKFKCVKLKSSKKDQPSYAVKIFSINFFNVFQF